MRSILPRTIQARLILSHLLVSLVSIVIISVYAGGMLFNATYSQVRYQYQDVGLVTLDALKGTLHRLPFRICQPGRPGRDAAAHRPHASRLSLHPLPAGWRACGR